MSVEQRLGDLNEKIRQACARAGRFASSVELIAVSKTKTLAEIREAYESGQKIFGENYVQELVPKIEQLENASVRWHFIGPLQSNKVRKIIGKVELIHSVDRESVLKETHRQAESLGIRQNILIQVNYTKEPSKGGVFPEELESFVKLAAGFSGVELRGLMVMPPFTENPEENRPIFRGMRTLLIDLREQFFKDKGSQFSHLSMGTSQDFEVAIEEGATLVRVGTDVFGPREG